MNRSRGTSVLLNWATGLSILISCLGLLGLVVYTTERRTKEIGIRKVLGASIVQLNLLLCREFLMLVGIAFALAVPVAWYGIKYWLEAFAYKTAMSWWIFSFQRYHHANNLIDCYESQDHLQGECQSRKKPKNRISKTACTNYF